MSLKQEIQQLHNRLDLANRKLDAAKARQDSAMMACFAAADCLVVRAPEAPAAKAGDQVLITRLDTGMSRF